MRSRLHVRWGDPPHVTAPIWGPPTPCKQALKGQEFNLFPFLSTLGESSLPAIHHELIWSLKLYDWLLPPCVYPSSKLNGAETSFAEQNEDRWRMSTAAPAFKHANNDIDPVYRFPHLPLGKIGFILREGGSVHRLRCFTRLARPGISTVVRL